MKKNAPLLPDKPELSDKTKLPLYRAVLPKTGDQIRLVFFCIGLALFLAAVSAGIIWLAGDREWDVWDWVYILLLPAALLFAGAAIRSVYQTQMRRYAKRWAVMNMLSVEEIIALQNEIAKAKLWFGTFYLLEYYLYAPEQKLLVHYGDIAGWKQLISSSVEVEISEQDGTFWQVTVRDWKAFLRDWKLFREMLEYHVGQCGGSL